MLSEYDHLIYTFDVCSCIAALHNYAECVARVYVCLCESFLTRTQPHTSSTSFASPAFMRRRVKLSCVFLAYVSVLPRTLRARRQQYTKPKRFAHCPFNIVCHPHISSRRHR